MHLPVHAAKTQFAPSHYVRAYNWYHGISQHVSPGFGVRANDADRALKFAQFLNPKTQFPSNFRAEVGRYARLFSHFERATTKICTLPLL